MLRLSMFGSTCSRWYHTKSLREDTAEGKRHLRMLRIHFLLGMEQNPQNKPCYTLLFLEHKIRKYSSAIHTALLGKCYSQHNLRGSHKEGACTAVSNRLQLRYRRLPT